MLISLSATHLDQLWVLRSQQGGALQQQQHSRDECVASGGRRGWIGIADMRPGQEKQARAELATLLGWPTSCVAGEEPCR